MRLQFCVAQNVAVVHCTKRDSSPQDLCTTTSTLASKQAPVSFCLWPKALIDHVKHHEKSHKLPALQTNQWFLPFQITWPHNIYNSFVSIIYAHSLSVFFPKAFHRAMKMKPKLSYKVLVYAPSFFCLIIQSIYKNILNMQ